MRDYTQNFCKTIGNEGCLCLCYIDVAEEFLQKPIDIIRAIEKAIDNGFVYFNKDNYEDSNNLYVKYGDKFLKQMTGVDWQMIIAEDEPIPQYNQFVIEKWVLRNERGVSYHFERHSKPILKNSNIVKKGVLQEFRIWMPKNI